MFGLRLAGRPSGDCPPPGVPFGGGGGIVPVCIMLGVLLEGALLCCCSRVLSWGMDC